MTADDLRTLIGANRQACVAQKTNAEELALMNQGALNILDQLTAQMEAMEKAQTDAPKTEP